MLNLPRKRALWVICAVGAAIRVILFLIVTIKQGESPWKAHWINTVFSERIEINPPNNSFRRLIEAQFLQSNGKSPYSGHVFHGTAFIFMLFHPLRDLPVIWSFLVLVAVDVATTFALRTVVQTHCSTLRARGDASLKHSGVGLVSLSFPDMLAACYLLNPFSVLSCVAMTTITPTYLCSVLSIVGALNGRLVMSVVWLSLATVLDIYPIMLISPIIILLTYGQAPVKSRSSKLKLVRNIFSVFLLTALIIGGLLLAAKEFFGDWSFVRQSYGFSIMVEDLQPTIGGFWYFFSEVFSQYRTLFLFIFQYHIFGHVLPFTVRFWKEPMFLVYFFQAFPAVFKTYPGIADFSYWICWFFIERKLTAKVKYGYVVMLCFAVAFCLGPVMWFMWIHPGSANANFFYNQTVLYMAGSAVIFFQSTQSGRHIMDEQ